VVFEDGTRANWRAGASWSTSNFARSAAGRHTHSRPDATGSVGLFNTPWSAPETWRNGTIQIGSSVSADKAEGVAEVASVGGFVKHTQVVVDPTKLEPTAFPTLKVTDAIRFQQYGRSVGPLYRDERGELWCGRGDHARDGS